MEYLALVVALCLLLFSANYFVDGAVAVAQHLGVSPLLIGLTIVGFGTSVPEILVALVASLQGNVGLAVGNALGSNIANIGLILGATALVAPVMFHSRLLRRELPVLLLITIFCYLLAWNGLSLVDGFAMLLLLLVFFYWVIQTALHEKPALEVEAPNPEKTLSKIRAGSYLAVGLVGLVLSSKLLVWAAVTIAVAFGVSDLVIGLTVVAVGTSLPELAAAISSVLKGKDDLAVGNVIGSNVYNLLAVYSIPAFVGVGQVEHSVLERDFPVLIGFTAVLFLLGWGRKSEGLINRWEGGGLLAVYLYYQWIVYQSSV